MSVVPNKRAFDGATQIQPKDGEQHETVAFPSNQSLESASSDMVRPIESNWDVAVRMSQTQSNHNSELQQHQSAILLQQLKPMQQQQASSRIDQSTETIVANKLIQARQQTTQSAMHARSKGLPACIFIFK